MTNKNVENESQKKEIRVNHNSIRVLEQQLSESQKKCGELEKDIENIQKCSLARSLKATEYAGEVGLLQSQLKEINDRVDELIEYCNHGRDCVAGEWREGKPTENGYETLYGYGKNAKWYKENEKPKCTCGLKAIVSFIKGDKEK